MAKVVHKTSVRMRNNAGMDYPLCYAIGAQLLDTDKVKLPQTQDKSKVTCLRCLVVMKRNNFA